MGWFTQEACVFEQWWLFNINAVENGLENMTTQSKRPLKTWWAMAPITTLFSVLLPSWVDSPRKHEYVTFVNMISNGSSFHTVFSPNAKLGWFTQVPWVCELWGWLHIHATESSLNLRTVHSKRPLKTWWAMASYTTLFSVLSPRKHEYVDCDGDWAYMLLKTA